MAAFKLIVAVIAATSGQQAEPKMEGFNTWDACVQAQEMYRSVPGVKAKCILDGAEYLPPTNPHLVYRGPAPLDRLPYGAVPSRDGGYVYPLPRLAPPQGPAPWPQDY